MLLVVSQRRRGQARLHLGPALQHLPGTPAARRRGELGGFQPRRSGAAAVCQRRLHHQSVALATHGASDPRPAATRPETKPHDIILDSSEPAAVTPETPETVPGYETDRVQGSVKWSVCPPRSGTVFRGGGGL